MSGTLRSKIQSRVYSLTSSVSTSAQIESSSIRSYKVTSHPKAGIATKAFAVHNSNTNVGTKITFKLKNTNVRHPMRNIKVSRFSSAVMLEPAEENKYSTRTSNFEISSSASTLSLDENNPKTQLTRTIRSQHVNPMPRLEKLRQRLRSENDTGAKAPSYSVKVESNSSCSTPQSGKTKELPSSSPSTSSWKDILTLAKAHLNSTAIQPQLERTIPQDENNIYHDQRQYQRMLLTDSYSRHHSYLRISLVEKCNLRCRYCMPPEGVPLQSNDKLLTTKEVERLTRLFASGGVDKVRLTGGEPLLRRDLTDVISSISSIPTINSVGITTNGITLSRKLPSLVDAGLTHVNISLDTLQDDKFLDITRRKGLSKVLRAIQDAAEILPPGHVKVNCVVMKNFNENELRDFIMITKDLPVDMRFIEWMPFSDNGWSKNRFVSYKDMMSRITDGGDVTVTGCSDPASLNGVPPLQLVRSSDGPNDTTKWWNVPGHLGRVGFITSMSQNFCGTCNRLRITADGQLKVCLFGSTEVSLRDALRAGVSDEDLGLVIGAAVRRKKFALGGHGNAEGIAKANDNRPMTLIGG